MIRTFSCFSCLRKERSVYEYIEEIIHMIKKFGIIIGTENGVRLENFIADGVYPLDEFDDARTALLREAIAYLDECLYEERRLRKENNVQESEMSNITVCTKCGKCYEEVSEEEANAPHRRCQSCYRQLDERQEIEPYQYGSMKAAPVTP